MSQKGVGGVSFSILLWDKRINADGLKDFPCPMVALTAGLEIVFWCSRVEFEYLLLIGVGFCGIGPG